MKVQDILQKKSGSVLTIHPHQTLFQASQILAEHNIGALLVEDDAHELVGILSERDIVRQLAQAGESVGKLTVGEVMTTDVVTVLPDDEIADLSSTMTNKRIRHLPVMQDGQLIGIVSIGDVVKAQLDFYEGESQFLQTYIAGGYA